MAQPRQAHYHYRPPLAAPRSHLDERGETHFPAALPQASYQKQKAPSVLRIVRSDSQCQYVDPILAETQPLSSAALSVGLTILNSNAACARRPTQPHQVRENQQNRKRGPVLQAGCLPSAQLGSLPSVLLPHGRRRPRKHNPLR